jgi:DNA-binding transcriptional regulator YdaS (Cro superfamily)
VTPAEFSTALDVLGWSRRHLVEQLGCDTTLANRWASGRAPIPPPIARWLERRVRDDLRAPVPDGWRVRPVREAAE